MAEPEKPETAEEKPPEPGRFGTFLSEKGVKSGILPDSTGVETIEVAGEDLVRAMEILKADPEIALNYLVAVSGVDSDDTFVSVYHLWSYQNDNELVIKVRVAKSEIPEGRLPQVPSITPMWKAADWHERESYDLVGIRYIGHPYLRRILNPWDWEGHPLRHDYKQPVDALNDKAPGSMR